MAVGWRLSPGARWEGSWCHHVVGDYPLTSDRAAHRWLCKLVHLWNQNSRKIACSLEPGGTLSQRRAQGKIFHGLMSCWWWNVVWMNGICDLSCWIIILVVNSYIRYSGYYTWQCVCLIHLQTTKPLVLYRTWLISWSGIIDRFTEEEAQRV